MITIVGHTVDSMKTPSDRLVVREAPLAGTCQMDTGFTCYLISYADYWNIV